MKKSYLFKFILLSVLMLGFVACGSDDDDPTPAEQSAWIVGEWIVDSNNAWALPTIKFNADGTFTESLVSTTSIAPKVGDPYGEYRINESNKLELKYSDSDKWVAQKFKMSNKDSFHLNDIKYVKRK